MAEADLTPRPVRDSQSEMAEIVLPNDANPLGALLGGRLMHWIDLAGALAAHRHSRNHVVTASVDHIDFLVPVRVGDLVISALIGEPCLPHVDGSRRQGVRRKLHCRYRKECCLCAPDVRCHRCFREPGSGTACDSGNRRTATPIR